MDFDKLATELGYTSSSAKVMYGNARRKLIRATGITQALVRLPAVRHLLPLVLVLARLAHFLLLLVPLLALLVLIPRRMRRRTRHTYSGLC